MIIDLPLNASTVLLMDIGRKLGVQVEHDNAKSINSRRFGGQVLRFDHTRLRPMPGSDTYRSYSDGGVSDVDGTTRLTGRRKNAVCWHAHRDWMRGILEIHPDAIIDTGLATYRGSQHFEDTHEDTRPDIMASGRVYWGEVCKCSDER